MKVFVLLLLTSLSILLTDCKHPTEVQAAKDNTPFFSQVNVRFEDAHFQCLIDQWYNRTYQNEPIVFRVINDATSYAAFIGCSQATSLPFIDFTNKSLLIGMKADYGNLINTPVNISRITQTLRPASNGSYLLQVTVRGETSPSAMGQGGEWFAFAVVVPKVTGNINLDMQYQYQ